MALGSPYISNNFMKRALKYTIYIAIFAPIILISATYLSLRSERFVTGYLLPFVSEKSGTPISATRASIKLFSEIDLGGLTVGESSSDRSNKSGFKASAKNIYLGYNFWSLFSRKLAITKLKVDELNIALAPEANATASTPITPTPTVNTDSTPTSNDKPAFVITLSDVSINDSSFKYRDISSNSSYTLNGIKIEIPNGDSNGETDIKLKLKASVDSSALKLQNEDVSGSLTLKDAVMFAPGAIGLSAKIGQAAPTPLEFTGSLDFQKNPYGLNLVSIDKAIIRDSLLKTLAISGGPIESFEYEVSGAYPIALNTPFDVKLLVKKAIINSANDLKGTALTANLSLYKDSVAANRASLELYTNGALAAKSSLKGSFPFDPLKGKTRLDLNLPIIDFDLIESAISPTKPAENEAAKTEPASTPEATPSPIPTTSSSTDALKLPVIEAQIAIDKATYKKTGISDVKLDVNIPKSNHIEKAQFSAKFDGGGNLSVNSSGTIDQTINLKAKADKVNVLPLAALALSGDELLEGNLDLLDLDLSIAPNNPRTTLTGKTRVNLSRFIVPSTLHGQVPFNILFLPFDALITVFGGAINAILPKSVSSISDGIREVLDDAGRLGIEKGVIDLAFNQGEISCNKVEIDTKNLPDFNIKGKVTAKDGLDFTIFIALLKLNLPLPVAGTLSTPLPDVVYLGPEIVRGLGLSIGNIAGSAASLFTGSSEEPLNK
jgi:hypothetical protein